LCIKPTFPPIDNPWGIGERQAKFFCQVLLGVRAFLKSAVYRRTKKEQIRLNGEAIALVNASVAVFLQRGSSGDFYQKPATTKLTKMNSLS
jgi:hypothetical protein